MQLSEIEREQLYAIVEKYDHHPDVQRMREYIQHGSVTTYQHCKNVALVSFWLNRRLHLHADETSLAVGALLHDFYLYDWHTTGTFHGLRRLFEMHTFCTGCLCLTCNTGWPQSVCVSKVRFGSCAPGSSAPRKPF